jgi:hypothetical protein
MVLIQTFEDGSPTAKALFEYETMDAAKSALFSTMFSSMANDNIKSVMCEIINDRGGVLKHEIWERNPEAVEE